MAEGSLYDGLPANAPESVKARIMAARLLSQAAGQQTAPYTSKAVVGLKAIEGLMGGLQERSAINEAQQGQADQRRMMAQLLLGSLPATSAGGLGPTSATSAPGMIPGSSPTGPAGALPAGNGSTRDLAIRTIYGEAGGEPDVGKVGVASVLKNRLASGQFGSDMNSVIMAPKQFSLWNPGDPAGDTARKLSPNNPAYQKIGAIYDGVMSGDVADPTGGATHYYNPKAASPSWGPKLAAQNDVMIGNHRFVGAGPTGPNGAAPARSASADAPAPNAQAVSSPTLPPGISPDMVSASAGQPSPFGAMPSGMGQGAPSPDNAALAAALRQQAGIPAPSAPSPSPFGAMPTSMAQPAPAGVDPTAVAAALQASAQGATPSATPTGTDVSQPPMVPPPQGDLTAPSPFGAGPSPMAPPSSSPNSQALAAALRQQVAQKAPTPAVPSPAPQDPTGLLSPNGLQMAGIAGGDPSAIGGMAQAAPPVSAAPLSTDNALGFDNLNTTTNPDGTPAVTQSSLGAPGFTGAPADGSAAAAINGSLPGPQAYVGGPMGLGTGPADPSTPSPAMLAQALRQSTPTPTPTPTSAPTQPPAASAPVPRPAQVAALPSADDPVGGLMGSPPSGPSSIATAATSAMAKAGYDTTGLPGAVLPGVNVAALGPAAQASIAKDAAANPVPMLAGANVPAPDLSGLAGQNASPPLGAAMPIMATQAANPPSVLAAALRARGAGSDPARQSSGDSTLPETAPMPPARPSDVALGLDPNAPAPNASAAGPAPVPPGLMGFSAPSAPQPLGLTGDGGADPSSPQAFMRQEAQRAAAGGPSPSTLAAALRANSPAAASTSPSPSQDTGNPLDAIGRLFSGMGGGSSPSQSGGGGPGGMLSGLPIIGDLLGGQQSGIGPNGQAAGSTSFGGQGQAQPFTPGGQGQQPPAAQGGQAGSAPVAGLGGMSQAQAVALLTNPYTTPQQAELIMSRLNPQPMKMTAGDSLAGRRPDGTYGTLYSAPTKPDWQDLGNGMMVDKNDPNGRAMPIPGGRAPVKMSPGDVLQGPNGPVASVPATPHYEPIPGTGQAFDTTTARPAALPAGAGSTIQTMKVGNVDVPVRITPDPNGGQPKVELMTPGGAQSQAGAPGAPISFNGTASSGAAAQGGPLGGIAPLVQQAGQMEAQNAAAKEGAVGQVKGANTFVEGAAKTGSEAANHVAEMQQLKSLGANAPTGFSADMARYASDHGWVTPTGDAVKSYDGLRAYLGTQLRQAGSGALRNSEMDKLSDALGSTNTSPPTRAAAVQRIQDGYARQAALGQVASDPSVPDPMAKQARIQDVQQTWMNADAAIEAHPDKRAAIVAKMQAAGYPVVGF